MARVTEAQQLRGNLGGPELFLAPVGRLPTDKITRFYCNTCDAEYVRPPKIEYENPNEMVADNLMLVEKGQYACDVCKSTIAEYREFEKPDEAAEAGAAVRADAEVKAEKPEAKAEEPAAEPEQAEEPEEPEAAEEAEPEAPAEEPEESEPEAEETEEAEPEAEEPEPEIPESVRLINGLYVYDHAANKVGVVYQMGIDKDMAPVVLVSTDDNVIVSVPWSQVRAIGDIILLDAPPPEEPESTSQPEDDTEANTMQSVDDATPTVDEESAATQCSKCTYENTPDASFCEACGNNLK